MAKTVEISVGLRLDNQEVLELKERKSRVEEILTEKGGTFTVTETDKKDYLEIAYDAILPIEQINLHHAFDSRLNKSWPEGAGAAWVSEI